MDCCIDESLSAMPFMAVSVQGQVKGLARLTSPEGASALPWRAAQLPGPGLPLETAAICCDPAMPAAGGILAVLSSIPAPSTRPVPAAGIAG